MSDILVELSNLIVRDDSGLAPLDITMLGRVAGHLEHLGMMLRHEESKQRIRDTRKGEWPSAGTRNIWWDDGRWRASRPKMIHGDIHLWLPAPPPPTEA